VSMMDARARHSAASGVSGVGESTPSAAAARSPLPDVGPPAVRASRRRAVDMMWVWELAVGVQGRLSRWGRSFPRAAKEKKETQNWSRKSEETA